MSAHPHADRRALSAPGVRRRGGRAIVVCIVLAGAMTACEGSGTTPRTAPPQPVGPSTQPPLGFRSPPSFLPKTVQPVDRVVTASTGHPQLAVQGIAVEVDLPSGHVLATVTGPRVPPFVAPPPPAVTATFDISLARVTGHVPVRLDDFTITDQLGRTFHPSLVTGETPPATTATGHAVRFQVTAVMPTGEGRLQWTPTGTTPVVSWDFIVEND